MWYKLSLDDPRMREVWERINSIRGRLSGISFGISQSDRDRPLRMSRMVEESRRQRQGKGRGRSEQDEHQDAIDETYMDQFDI